jgi:hypothetical protein
MLFIFVWWKKVRDNIKFWCGGGNMSSLFGGHLCCVVLCCVALSFFFDVMWWLNVNNVVLCGFACFFILVIHFLFLFSYWSTSSSIHLILISSLTVSYTKIAICSKRFQSCYSYYHICNLMSLNELTWRLLYFFYYWYMSWIKL